MQQRLIAYFYFLLVVVVGVVVSAVSATTTISISSKQKASEFKKSKDFLLKYMPENDKNSITDEYLNENIEYALKARYANHWASENIPFEQFLNNVLPYCNLNEPREPWRPMFYDFFIPLVSNTSSVFEAFTIINTKIWSIFNKNPIFFKSNQTPNIMSPIQTISNGFASCSGLSIFLVDALRAVGIPARVAGTAEWNTNNGGNHNWVELWNDTMNIWSFTEFNDTVLNQTWFVPNPTMYSNSSNINQSIYAASYAPADTYFPLAWDFDDHSVNAYERTDYYLKASGNISQIAETKKISYHHDEDNNNNNLAVVIETETRSSEK